MKKIWILLSFLLLITLNNGQVFFPANLHSLITDENLPENEIIAANEVQLNGKEFFYEREGLYRNQKSGEIVKITSDQTGNVINIGVDYYTVATDLSRFINRLNEFGLKKINENRYESISNTSSYKIQIQKNTIEDGKKYTMISLLFSKKQAIENNGKKEVFFPTVYKYPLQSTTYFFETHLKDNKDGKNEYFASIQLSEEPKYKNQIIFLDDVNFKVTLPSKKSFTGTYYVNENKSEPRPTVYFELTQPKIEKGGLRQISEVGLPGSVHELKMVKDPLLYNKYFFNRSYIFKFEKNDLRFENIVYENEFILSPSN